MYDYTYVCKQIHVYICMTMMSSVMKNFLYNNRKYRNFP